MKEGKIAILNLVLIVKLVKLGEKLLFSKTGNSQVIITNLMTLWIINLLCGHWLDSDPNKILEWKIENMIRDD